MMDASTIEQGHANMRSALLSRTVQTFRTELHIVAHQRVVSVTIGTLVATSYLDAGKVDTTGEDQVELMPVFDHGCLQETQCWGFMLKKVLLMHNPWWQQSCRRRWPLSFIFPEPNWPKQVGQELWSTPTLVLKSPAMNSRSLSGIILVAALRLS